MRTNAGYTITDSIHVGDVEFVLGEQPNGKMFVTWECKNGDDYYWGHYFDSLPAAKLDLLTRARGALEGNAPTPKPYFFCMTVCSRRTGAAIGRRCGVVLADSQESAELTAWERFGNDSACKLWVEEVTEDGYDYTVYKSEII